MVCTMCWLLCLRLSKCCNHTKPAANRHMNWWKERKGNAGFISDVHDGESWKAEVADPVMNKEGEVQMWLSDCGDGADPCAGKHRGPQSVFFSAERYFSACASICLCRKVPLERRVLGTLAIAKMTCSKHAAPACQRLPRQAYVLQVASIRRLHHTCLAAEQWQRNA